MDVGEQLAAHVICEAFRRHMYGDNYVWILHGFHSTRYFFSHPLYLTTSRWMHSGRSTCSYQELSQVLEGHFVTEFGLSRKDKDSKIISGKSAADVWEELLEADKQTNIWRGYLYDGLWTLALALSQSLEKNAALSHQKLISAMNNASFEGVTVGQTVF